MQNNETQWQAWIGNTETRLADITSYPMVAMAATLDRPVLEFAPGMAIPPLWHWLYFLETSPRSQLALDGHAEKGDFLPPVTLPRRMWAGSRLEFHGPLLVGDRATRTSTIRDVVVKQGKSGQLAFVTVEHGISTARGLALTEQHDIVYREPARPGAGTQAPTLAPEAAAFSRTVTPDPVLLFRYSALTFNGHRIHYDRDFATNTEAYPGLVVHGPLLATLLLELLLESVTGYRLRQFAFRARHPVFDLHPFQVCCNPPDADGKVSLWVQDHNNVLCMSASAVLEQSR